VTTSYSPSYDGYFKPINMTQMFNGIDNTILTSDFSCQDKFSKISSSNSTLGPLVDCI